MLNIYLLLNVTIEKNWRYQNLSFLSLKNVSPNQFFSSSYSCRYHWILKLFVATEKSEVWEENWVWLFYYFDFEKNYDVFKVKDSRHFVEKIYKFY